MEKFKLDFNIVSSKDRLEAVRSIDLTKLNKSELETVTNYIIYGKDDDGTSSVDRKEIQIKTKFDSYAKNKNIASLDELMESPTFDESSISKTMPNYKKIKPHIDEEKAMLIPEYRELKETIDKFQHIKDVNMGKEEDKEVKNLSQKELYYLTHHLIMLRKQQYYLMDAYYPTIGMQKNRLEYHSMPAQQQLQYPVYPRGIMGSENDKLFMEPYLDNGIAAQALDDIEDLNDDRIYFDFRNKDHLYYLIQYYMELKDLIEKTPDSPLWGLLWTLDFYIEKADLSNQQRLIVEDKKKQMMNRDIRQHLIDELGISHQENYISTIWSKSIELIIKAVELNYDEWLCKDYKKAWKKCNKCGKWMLRDPRNFVRKAKSLDGLTNRCKKCEKEVRNSKK